MAGIRSWLRLPFPFRGAHTATEPPLVQLCRTVTGSSLQAALAAAQDMKSWNRIGAHFDTEIYSKKDFTHYHHFMRKGFIKATPEQILAFLENPDNSRKWNETLEESRLLQTIEPYRILYQKVGLPWPLQARDFVLAAFGTKIDGGTAYILSSIEVPEAPPRRDMVRGHIDYSAVIAREVQGGAEVTYVSSVQLNEELPHRVVYHLIKQRNTAIVKIREMLSDVW